MVTGHPETFPEDVGFRHPWRPYQARVLTELEEHLSDNSLHVVAAPGSGKTVLGLEVVRRLGRPALILAPTLTIRDQWARRFVALFVPEPSPRPSWVSTSLERPGLLTVVTYQALHAACAGLDDEDEELPEEESGEPEEAEDAIERGADVRCPAPLGSLRESGIGTIVLDEAHHLRSEWWRTLYAVRRALPDATVVALTATPPYDVPASEWERYRELCGPFDAEVPVPELVLAGNLCPHQDYVYFSAPSSEEEAQLRAFREDVERVVTQLIEGGEFVAALLKHHWLQAPKKNIERILEDPEYFASMLVCLKQVGAPLPPGSLDILGVPADRLPPLTNEWLETLLSRCVARENPGLPPSEAVFEEARRDLTRIGALERGRVRLETNTRLERRLVASITKLDSIAAIVKLESGALGGELRLLVLTDYIRAADMPRSRDDVQPLSRLGVVPIFERIRREGIPSIRLAVVTGSLVIVPREAGDRLASLARAAGLEADSIRCSPLPHDDRYLSVALRGGDRGKLVRLITQLFASGDITVLVGTASLLGEGWDAPAINTLILASYVGSYMLSNQMRGRAIRTQPDNPDKTANIWHLVCVEPGVRRASEDLETLDRRFRAFVGVGLEDPIIESGISRLQIDRPPYSRQDIAGLNREMTSRALARDALREQWQQALLLGQSGVGAVQELRAPPENIPYGFVFTNTIAALCAEGLFIGGFLLLHLLGEVPRVWAVFDFSAGSLTAILAIVCLIAAVAALPNLLKGLWLFLRHGPIAGSVKQVGEAVAESLRRTRLIKTPASQLRVMAKRYPDGTVYCSLKGGTTYEQTTFLDALQDVLDPIENPRYLLLRKSAFGLLARTDYHAVPTILGRRRSDAECFARAWAKYVGRARLTYTRTLEGRKILLRARSQSLSASFIPRSERVSCWK
jgi:superfamily II DNA or RNA helicase